MAAAPSPTHLLVLRRLRRTPAEDLLRRAVGELVDAGVLELDRHDGGPGGGAGRLLLREGSVPAPRGGALGRVAAAVAAVPPEVVGGADARDVAVVARHLARAPGLGREVLGLVLAELEAVGWVATEQRPVLRLFPRSVSVRTPAGEAVLAAAGPARDRTGSDGGAAVTGGGDGGPRGELDARFHDSFDGAGGGDGGDGGGGGD